MTKAGIASTALVVIATAGIAGAWYTGTQLEAVLQQNIQQANQQLNNQFPNTDLALELASLEKGLFSSQARYRLVVQAPETDSSGMELFINDRIEHGPWPASRLVSFKWLPVMAVSHAQLEPHDALTGLFAASAGRPPVTLTSSVGYGRGIQGEFEVAPLNWSSSGVNGNFSGLSAVYRTDAAGSAFKLKGRVDSMELQSHARVSLVGMDITLDRQRHASGLYLGTGRVELDQLAVVADDIPAVVISEMLQADTTTMDADGANMALTYRIGSVNYGANRLGSLDMGWTLSRFDPQAMMALASLYNSVIFETDNTDPQAIHDQFQAALEQLLDGHPRLSLDNLSLRTANGESRFSLGLDLDRPQSLQLPPDLLWPQLIANLEARLVLSKPMLMDMLQYRALFQPQTGVAAVERDAALMVEMLSGMAEMLQLGRVEGDNIVSQLSYTGGAVQLNGQAMELEELTGLLSQSMQ